MERIRRVATAGTERLSALRRRRTADPRDADSWVMTCPCGTTVSMWDLGGLRTRLSAKRAHRAAVCPSCRQRFVGQVRRIPI